MLLHFYGTTVGPHTYKGSAGADTPGAASLSGILCIHTNHLPRLPTLFLHLSIWLRSRLRVFQDFQFRSYPADNFPLGFHAGALSLATVSTDHCEELCRHQKVSPEFRSGQCRIMPKQWVPCLGHCLFRSAIARAFLFICGGAI